MSEIMTNTVIVEFVSNVGTLKKPIFTLHIGSILVIYHIPHTGILVLKELFTCPGILVMNGELISREDMPIIAKMTDLEFYPKDAKHVEIACGIFEEGLLPGV